jgi:hypothetical protein
MYPSLPGRNDPPRGTYGSYGLNSNILSTPSHGSAAASHAQQQHAGAASGLASASSLDCSPWGTETSSTLRVKLAENFKLAPAVSGKRGTRARGAASAVRAWTYTLSPARHTHTHTHTRARARAPQVQVPPALAASSRSLQEVDYDFERQVLSNDASTSFDGFLSKPEVCGGGQQAQAMLALHSRLAPCPTSGQALPGGCCRA